MIKRTAQEKNHKVMALRKSFSNPRKMIQNYPTTHLTSLKLQILGSVTVKEIWFKAQRRKTIQKISKKTMKILMGTLTNLMTKVMKKTQMAQMMHSEKLQL